MKNTQGEILYIGKAKNLRSRVSSYFGVGDGRYQIHFLMKKVADIETVLTQNEKEALLLENTLIKKHKPRYNVFLKDDKTFPSIKINIQHEFPRIFSTRYVTKDGSRYYGPYTSAYHLYEILNFIQNNFRLRNCSDHDFANRSRPCLQYQIKRCDAPCVGYVNSETYQAMVKEVQLFLEGRNQELKHLLQEKMKEAASKEDFEKAAYYRDLLQSISIVLEKQEVQKHEEGSLDVWGFSRSAEKVALVLLQVREGRILDKKEWLVNASLLQDNEECLSSFLTQFYVDALVIQEEILLPFELSNQKELSEIFCEIKGSKVQVKNPERGSKKARQDLAQYNADEMLKQALLQKDAQQESLKKLQDLLGLKKLPQRMECYDISNFQGDSAVGSCVCFIDGKADKKFYRRFKIKYTQGPNDFAMHYEMMKRRLTHTEWPLPDLMVIDGGKGQLSSANAALKEAQIEEVEIVGLAKEKTLSSRESESERGDLPGALGGLPRSARNDKPERVFLLNRKDPIIPHPKSAECQLLVRIRDEAHRFGIEYHRKLRGKKSISSLLDTVEGLGTKRKKLLLSTYQSPKNIFLQGLDKVHQETKIPRDVLEKLFQILSEKISEK